MSTVQISSQQVDRWRTRLSNLTEFQLPSDYPRPLPPKFVDSVETKVLSETTSLSLLQLSLTNHVTDIASGESHPASPFLCLLTAFGVLLHKYTGEEDIVVGSSSNSANPLVLRLPIKSEHTFAQLLQKVHEVEQEAQNDEIPFAELFEALYPTTTRQEVTPPPLFRVRFFNETDTSEQTFSQTTSLNDLTVVIRTSQNGSLRSAYPAIEVSISYNQVLFSSSRIAHILDQIELVLNQAVQEPKLEIGLFTLVTPRCLKVIPDPTLDLHWSDFKGGIHDIFTKNAHSFPERPCLIETLFDINEGVTGTRTFTYAQVNHASNQVAQFLLNGGVEREDVITMYAYRGVDLVIGVMGILKCGAIFNVLDPAYPPERQNIYLSVAKPAAILNLKRAGELLPPVREYIQNELDIKCELSGLELLDDGTLVYEENNEQKPLQLTNEDVNVEVGPDSVATLSFTSGSTGIPKGVRGRHYSLTHFYPWMAEKFGLSERDRFTMLSGIAHDPIQRDIFTPLFLGSELRIPHPDIITTPGQLAEWMRDNEVTTSHLTPAMGQLLSANAQVEIPSLFNIFFVGDILTKRDCLRLQQFAPNVRIINMYGTTETQRAVSYYLIPPNSTHPSFLSSVKDVLPAGQGMVDVQLLVVSRMTDKDGKRRMCGVGEAGEIYVRSGGLSEGYLRLGDVTKEKFQTNWFATGPPQNDQQMPFYLGARDRMYKSGDLGRYLPDGTVECVGRADDQVKIRGFRIELGEIDTHLSQHPRVRENVTLVKRDRNEEQTLISYFVPNELDDVEAEETSTDEADEDGPPRRYTRLIRNLRNYLKQKLPAYSVPALIVPLRKLPLTPNGKIDKNALPFPDTAEYLSKYQSKPANENLTSTQKAVHQVWAQVLNIKGSIDLEDNFFDLGGHSILATRLLFQIRQALAVNVSLGLVFNHPTIEKMSAEIDKIKNIDLNLVTNTPISTPDLRKLTLEPETSDEEIFNYSGEFEKISQSAPWSSWTPETAPKLRVPNPETPVYFLTGATGFLGSFILARLLQRYPTSTVYCLARGESNEKAYERIKSTLESNVLWQSGFENRIIGVQGDLAQPKLGVSDSMWEELKTKVDSVIHNGALVHWVFPYSKLRDPNVNGTLEALKLSVSNSGEMKGFHFVSSTSVLDTEHYVRLSELNLSSKSPVHLGVPENDDLLGSQHGLRSGYGQTKWVCEKLVMDAHSKGAYATIIRPGYIVGDCQTGVSITDDFLWRLIKGCIQIGKVPSMTNRVNMCSVDYVADVVIGAAANPTISVPKGIFHVSNPHPFQFNQFFDFLSQYGYSVQTEDYVTWRDILMDVTLSDQDNALYPLLHFVLDDLPTSTKSPELDQTNCVQLIKEWNAGVECKPMQDLIPLYLSYLVHVGFLSQPQDSTKNQLPALPEGLQNVLTSTGRGGRS